MEHLLAHDVSGDIPERKQASRRGRKPGSRNRVNPYSARAKSALEELRAIEKDCMKGRKRSKSRSKSLKGFSRSISKAKVTRYYNALSAEEKGRFQTKGGKKSSAKIKAVLWRAHKEHMDPCVALKLYSKKKGSKKRKSKKSKKSKKRKSKKSKKRSGKRKPGRPRGS